MFVARPPATPPRRPDLHLVRAVGATFTGPAEFLADRGNRARVGEYLADMARPYGREVPAALFGEPSSPARGHSYGEMAQALIGPAVLADEPVDLLVLAFSVHDLRPGRQTAAYLSHLTPAAPMAFAICDQGSAAAFSGLRIIDAYASSAGIRRALLIVVEQADLPYDCPVTLPVQHRGVAMLYADGAMSQPQARQPQARQPQARQPQARQSQARQPQARQSQARQPQARVSGMRQHPGARPGDVAGLADADLAELAAGHREVSLVVSDPLAATWTAPAAGRVRVMPPGQPSTAVWSGLIDELTGDAGHPDLVVAADYDPGLRYLSLTAFETGPRSGL